VAKPGTNLIVEFAEFGKMQPLAATRFPLGRGGPGPGAGAGGLSVAMGHRRRRRSEPGPGHESGSPSTVTAGLSRSLWHTDNHRNVTAVSVTVSVAAATVLRPP
jgi:hypothetical protein